MQRRRMILLVAAVIVMSVAALAQGDTVKVDTTRRDSVHFAAEIPVQFPTLNERLVLLGVMVVGIGGLALILHAKRVMADARSRESNTK